MRRMSALLFVLMSLAGPAAAQGALRPIGQIPLLPIPDGVHEDIDSLLLAHWQTHFNTNAENAFGRDNVRVGRFDLDGDNRAELVLMVDSPAWRADPGNPFMIAQWVNKRWVAVGWGWGDEDTVFATNEVQGGWRTIDTGTQLLRWTGRDYAFTEKQ